MMCIISIVVCSILSFLYIIIHKAMRKVGENKFIKNYYNYIWGAVVLAIALLYPNSLVRKNSFDFFYNFQLLRDVIIIAAVGAILSCASGYRTKNNKYDYEFSFLFPIFEEILFRGVIMSVLINEAGMSNTAAIIISAFLFGTMHFQYFGINKESVGFVLYGYAGGYFFAKLALSAQSLIPSMFVHMVFNSSAIIYTRMRKSKREHTVMKS